MNLLRSISLLTLASAALSAPAALLIDPTGGSTVFGTANDQGEVRSLGGTFSLYGVACQELVVSTNGYLTAGPDGTRYSSRPLGELADVAGGPVIAGLFDDFVTNSVTDQTGNGFYAATYDANGRSDRTAGANSVFQVALFNAAGTFQGVSVQAGDIVFSYDKLNSEIVGGAFTVGLAESESNFTAPFGGDGEFADFASFTSGFDPATQALRFRYDAANDRYDSSVVTLGQAPAVPGPLAALPFALIALNRRRKRA